MRSRSGPYVVALSLAAWACSSPPPPVVEAPAVVVAPPPPPERARWAFADTDSTVEVKFDLGGGDVLYTSTNGRRHLARKDGPLVDAPTLALTDLLGVLKDGHGHFVFVGSAGEIYRTDEPLGPLSAPTPPIMKGSKKSWWTSGRAAFVGISAEDGRLFRSADYGATFQTVSYPGSNGYGKAKAVELDAQGNGLLLRFPQKVFATHDDGATWTELASPGIGAKRVLRDGSDRLYLEGRPNAKGTPRARLDGSKLVVTTEEPTPLWPNSRAAEGKCGESSSGRRTLVAGDRVVEFAESGKTGITVATGRLARGAGSPKQEPDLGPAPLSDQIASYGRDVVYLAHEEPAPHQPAKTSVLRSEDGGEHWQKEATLEGVDVQNSGGIDLAVGPSGFTYVTSLCGRPTPEGRVCAHRQVRPAGAASFEDLQFDEEMSPLAFAFDVPHDRAYALAVRGDELHVYESPLSKNHFVRTNLLNVPSGRSGGISVDEKGVVRVFTYAGENDGWAVHERAGSGEVNTAWLPLGRGPIAFAGRRGLVFGPNGSGWETADAGVHWIRTATSGQGGDLDCSEAGCVTGGARRIGWDLPAVTDEPLITAGPQKATAPATVVSLSTAKPRDFVCTKTGAATTLESMPGTELVDNHGSDVRWASVRHSGEGERAVVYGTRSAVHEAVLLPALPKSQGKAPAAGSPTVVSGVKVLNDGVVAARYTRYDPVRAQPAYVDIELAWWSASTGRIRRHTLKKLTSFYLPSEGNLSGTPQIVEGGLVFELSGHTTFIHDDGRTETLTVPAGSGVQNAERIGSRWLMADSSYGTVAITSSSDHGQTWFEKDWGLGDGGHALVVLLDGQPTLAFTEEGAFAPSLLVGIPRDVPNDPPPPVVIDPSNVDMPCDAHAGSLRLSTTAGIASLGGLHAHLTSLASGSVASADTRVSHVEADGKICTSAYGLTGYDSARHGWNKAFLYPEAKGWDGWWFETNVDPKHPTLHATAEPVRCTLQP